MTRSTLCGLALAGGLWLLAPRTALGQSATPPPTALPTTAASPTTPTTTAPPTASGTPTSTGPTATATTAGASTPAALPVDRPILVLAGSDVDPGSPGPGDQVAVRLEVKNVGRVDAENVELSVSSSVLRAIGRGATLYKEEIDAGETRPFDLSLRVDSAAVAGVYDLAISLRWEDALGTPYADQTSLGIRVHTSTVVRPQLVVREARVPSRVAPGVGFQIGLVVENGGGSDALNVYLTTGTGPLAPREASPPVSVAPGAQATLTQTVVAAAAPAPGAVTQELDIHYSDSSGVQYADSYPVGLVISGEAALGPLPMVTHYTVGADQLAPGQVFDLELDIENVGAREALHTSLVMGGGSTISSGATGAAAPGSGLGVFGPLDTSNVRYLGRLAAGATTTLSQKMVVSGSAKAGVYVLDIAFEFTDPDGQPQTASSVVSLLVNPPVRLLVNAVDVITTTVVGQPHAFSVEIVNAGQESVNVGNVTVDGGRTVDVTDGTTFVGPLDAGGFFPVDTTLTPLSPGKATITVRVEYVDDFSRQQATSQPFTFQVLAAPEPSAAQAPVEAKKISLWLRVVKGFLGLGASSSSAVPSAQPAATPAPVGRPAPATGAGAAVNGPPAVSLTPSP